MVEDQLVNMEHFADASHWDLNIFIAERKAFKNLLDFGYASAHKEYQCWEDYRRSQHYNEYEPYPWEKHWEAFHPTSIPVSVFFEKYSFQMSMIHAPHPLPPAEESTKSAMILDNEWNSVFIIAETEDIYVGYWWYNGE